MSKLISELSKASEQRAHITASEEAANNYLNQSKKETKMRKSLITFLFIAVAAVMVFIVWNNQGGKDAVPLSEIFPEEEVMPVEVEYEFVEETAGSEKQKAAAVPAAEPKAPVVSAQVSEPAAAPIPTAVQVIPEASFAIQIASYKDRKTAEEGLVKIRKNVPSAYIGERNLGSRGVWYRVYAGPYKLRSEAEVSLSAIKKNYNDSFIISPKGTK